MEPTSVNKALNEGTHISTLWKRLTVANPFSLPSTPLPRQHSPSSSSSFVFSIHASHFPDADLEGEC